MKRFLYNLMWLIAMCAIFTFIDVLQAGVILNHMEAEKTETAMAVASPVPTSTPIPTAAAEPTPTPEPAPQPTPTRSLLGTFQLYGYCPCSKCCGKYASGYTATGVIAVEGITVAVDPKVIPLGTKLYIEGVGDRIAQDTGVSGNTIDVYVQNHNDAYQAKYNQRVKVYKIEEAEK